jgi:hypothetical protein
LFETTFVRRRITLGGLYIPSTISLNLSGCRPQQTNQTLASRIRQIPQKLSLPQDSALTAPRLETERQPVPCISSIPAGQNLYRNLTRLFRRFRSQGNLRHSWKINCLAPKVNTFFGSLFNKDIPETELSQHKKLTGSPMQNSQSHDQ